MEINWSIIKSSLADVEQIHRSASTDKKEANISIAKLLYEIETELTKLKLLRYTPTLNNIIRSSSAKNSFDKAPFPKNIFRKKEVTTIEYFEEYDDYFRQNDYQYWLLIFLLVKNNEIREKNLTLYKIVDQFVERVQDTSFTWKDIEFTGSGATRCRTNLRFSYDDLKKAGLVNLYDKKHKNSWTLTYLGFFTAVSFCLRPVDKEKRPLAKTITRFYQSTFYFRLNKYIWKRIYNLSKSNYFFSLVEEMKIESLDLKELEKGPEIFKGYYDHCFSLQGQSQTKRGPVKSTWTESHEQNQDGTLYL